MQEQKRRLHVRRLLELAGEREECIVDCRKKDWPRLEQCVGCARFRGYSLDPAARDSFVKCVADEPTPLRACVGEGPAQRTCVRDVMSDPICVGPELSIDEVRRAFTELGIGGAPVVDRERRPLGVVSKTDLVRDHDGHRASDVMTMTTVTIAETASLADAVALMSRNRLHRLPVLSKEGCVVGVVTTFDVTRWLAS